MLKLKKINRFFFRVLINTISWFLQHTHMRFKPPKQAKNSEECQFLFKQIPNASSKSFLDCGHPNEKFFYAPPLTESRDFLIYTYHKSYICGVGPIALNQNGELIHDAIFRSKERIASALKKDSIAWFIFSLGCYKPARLNGKIVLLISNWLNYGHWITEHLLKVIHIKEYLPNEFHLYKFAIPTNSPAFIKNSLQDIGVKASNIIELNLGVNSFYLIESLIVTTYPQPDNKAYKEISRLLLKNKKKILTTFSKKLYVKRSNSFGSRYIFNEKKVECILKNHGFLPFQPEKFTLVEQAQTFNNAEIVIGVNGSAMTNIIYMKPNSIVIEFFGNRIHFGFRQIAFECDLIHIPIYCEPQLKTLYKQHGGKVLDGGMNVDITELQALVLAIKHGEFKTEL